jgi:ATP-dependent RNA helicase MSS116, mitochondrial
MGFRADIDRILEFLPPIGERQTLLVSATIPASVRSIARSSMSKDYKFINTVSEEDSPVHAHVPQFSTILPSAKWELPHVMRLLAQDQLTAGLKQAPGYGYGSKVIIFLPTTKKTQLYATAIRELSRDLLPAGRQTKIYEIHSKKSQNERERYSSAFRNSKNEHSILITSDVSARGVDYPGVTRVIQVGVPQSGEQYIHRVGRTGRGGPDKLVPGRARGDLVLQPWEVGFLTWQLTNVPLEQVTVQETMKDLEDLAKRVDESGLKNHYESLNPDAPPAEQAQPRRNSRRRGDFENEHPWSAFEKQLPYSPIATGDFFDSSVTALLPRLDEESIREVFTSLLGYYVGKSTEMRASKDTILDGCK